MKLRSQLKSTRSCAKCSPRLDAAEKQLNIRSILAPVDFSRCCRKAVQYAALLARDYHAGVTLAHISETKSGNGERLKRLENDLRKFAREVIPDEVPVSLLVKEGNPLREIVNLAEAGSVDLLVISTHARSGPPDFCLGSAAEQIVRYAPCPVLVVREFERDPVVSRSHTHDC